MDSLGIASFGGIIVICMFACYGIKCTPLDNKWIPFCSGGVGLILGLVAFYLSIPDFPASDPLTAAAVGILSGLSAVGLHQAYKQQKKTESDSDTSSN